MKTVVIPKQKQQQQKTNNKKPIQTNNNNNKTTKNHQNTYQKPTNLLLSRRKHHNHIKLSLKRSDTGDENKRRKEKLIVKAVSISTEVLHHSNRCAPTKSTCKTSVIMLKNLDMYGLPQIEDGWIEISRQSKICVQQQKNPHHQMTLGHYKSCWDPSRNTQWY